jgi:hypothetical protein
MSAVTVDDKQVEAFARFLAEASGAEAFDFCSLIEGFVYPERGRPGVLEAFFFSLHTPIRVLDDAQQPVGGADDCADRREKVEGIGLFVPGGDAGVAVAGGCFCAGGFGGDE